MDSLANNPLLQPAYVNRVLDAIIPDTAAYDLTTAIPMVTQETELVVVDVRQQIGGMTMAAAEGAESPIIQQRGMHQFAFMPAHFREKVLLSEKDTKVIRRLGTASELERAAATVARIVGELRMRLETRMEWAKWQMMYGTLAIDQPDINYSIDYHIPTHFQPTLTGADLWSDAASDPMSDWLDWLELYRDEGTMPEYFQYNLAVEKALLLNDAVRTLRDSLFSGQSNPAQLSRANLMQVFNAYAGIPVKIYDKGYFLIEGTTAALAPAGTSVTVQENPGFEIGDVITLVHKNGERAGRVRLTLTGVVGVTLSFAALGGTTTFPVGSEVRCKKHFLHDDKFIIRGALPPGTTGGQNWAEFVSTPHVYGPGGLMAPAPGIFMKTVVKDNDDPPQAMIISGISGLPVMYHTTVNVIATVL